MTKEKSQTEMLTKEWLDNKNISYKLSPDGKITVGGYLNLRGTKITKLPDNLTVGVSLSLQGTKITKLPDNLIVGGYLYLQDTKITKLPDNLTVGGPLDLRGTKITAPKELKKPSPDFSIKLRESIEVKFNLRGWSIADGILAKIISKKGAISQVLIAGKRKQSYLIRDKEGNYAHGETIAKAREDLIYKVIAKADVEIPKKATGKEWVSIYRSVTGACAAGVKHFVESNSIDLDANFTAAEISKMVAGQYGAEKFAGKLKD